MDRLQELYTRFLANLKAPKDVPKLNKEEALELVTLLRQAKASGARIAAKKPKGSKAADVVIDMEAFMKALGEIA